MTGGIGADAAVDGSGSTGVSSALVALLLGAAAAWFGGRTGVVDPTMTSFHLPAAFRRS
jgi:hypothetical protein